MEGIPIRSVCLSDIIEITVLEHIIEKFSKATKIAAVVVDFKGEPITKYTGFTDFCTAIRRNERCLNACFKSDAHGGVEAARSGKPFIYTCHSGLVDFAVPIIFEGQYLGSIMAGQVKLIDASYDQALQPNDAEVEAVLEDPIIRELYNIVPTIKVRELEAAADLLYIMANYIVSQGFNQKVQEELNRKNERLIFEMDARMSLENNLREAELKLLQSQVNPHFLFNVLNTINSLAMIETAPKTSEMVHSLSEMFRYTIKNKIHYLVTIEQELSYTENYMSIQKIRLNNRIKFKVDIPEKFAHIKIPFMIIQPLVSNAINHGLFNKKGDGLIEISGYEDAHNAYIKVEDNGIGIEKEVLKQLQDGTYTSDGSESTGIGMSNADKRLIHRFGQAYRLRIESEVGNGTCITIKLPK